MTAAGTWPRPPDWPPSRALGGWWRELSPRQPQRLWFTHLLLHHVEALAEVTQTYRPDAFQLLLLRLVAAADGNGPVDLDHLRMDRQLLLRWLHGLAAQG